MESSGNQRLAALVVGLMEQHERIVHLGLALRNREREFHDFHDDLVTALIDGDADRAAQLAEAALRGDRKKVMEAPADSAAQVSLGEWISVSEGAAVEGDSALEFHLSPRPFARRDLATGVSRKIRHGAWMMRVRGVGAVGGLILSTADARLPATPPAVSTAGRGASSEAPAFLGGLQCATSSTWTGSISTMVP